MERGQLKLYPHEECHGIIFIPIFILIYFLEREIQYQVPGTNVAGVDLKFEFIATPTRGKMWPL